jgi:hypothetical protein
MDTLCTNIVNFLEFMQWILQRFLNTVWDVKRTYLLYIQEVYDLANQIVHFQLKVDLLNR